MSSRSNSARPPRTVSISRPCGVDFYWNGSTGVAAPILTRARARVVRLDGEQAASKLAAMRAYREFAVLDRGPIAQLSNPAIHGYEVFWAVPRSGA